MTGYEDEFYRNIKTLILIQKELLEIEKERLVIEKARFEKENQLEDDMLVPNFEQKF